MKNLLILFILTIVTVFFSGCPYTSSVPIDKPNIKVENKYFGLWAEAKVVNVKYDVNKLNDYEYLITKLKDTTSIEDYPEYDGEEQSSDIKKSYDPTIYKGHISKIKDFYFLNVKEESGGFQSNEYNIYKIDYIDNSEFRLTEITSNIKEQFDNPDDLRNYIEKYMDAGISFFYGAEITYLKEK